MCGTVCPDRLCSKSLGDYISLKLNMAFFDKSLLEWGYMFCCSKNLLFRVLLTFHISDHYFWVYLFLDSRWFLINNMYGYLSVFVQSIIPLEQPVFCERGLSDLLFFVKNGGLLWGCQYSCAWENILFCEKTSFL